ncbi:PBP1A family penicillin-binding protein [Aneurinibacillus thermoaerophilus]|uniref:transglycosylase domain-containing protein n=1 Tax=Aneurinibacillus thermoaerophilus TaxID=143495 RepID=UPI002E1DE286|nr:PBP1A family penicillin-binding protein [Aneurinibacillus thermoaerophilus]MED0761429.1 PBP1A family penicillin-binding protein [Aneurinibacillus thermoaerophilus]
MEIKQEDQLIRWLKIVGKTTKYFFIALIVLAALFALFILYLRSQPLPETTINETTTIYGTDHSVIATLYKGENRVFLPLSQIPKYVQQASVAIEDRKFYEHPGFDIKRIAGAALTDLRHMNKREGASTITMQLARNLYLSLDKTWTRKFKEAILTIQLELNYTKPQLLEMYLNQIYYGHAAYGIQAAAKTYFGKNASELTLAEASMLAGLPKGPRFYSPFRDMKAAKSRQRIVLQAMVSEGYITQQQADAALAEPLKLASPESIKGQTIAPYFRDYVVKQAKEKYGIDEELIEHGGLKIYTTLDPVMQQKAESAVHKYLPKDRPLQAALVAIEPQTGYIRAMVGGRDYKESQFNRALARRQPGSSMKPALYMAALENGFTPLTKIKSEPTVFTFGNDETYIPRNFGEQYAHDYITMGEAIARSDNIYAVQTHLAIGPDKMVTMAKRLGIDSPLKPLPSLALGSYPVTPLEMTRMFATIANQGQKIEPLAIVKILDREGKLLVEAHPQVQQVVSRENAFILTHMLEKIFAPGGTAHRVSPLLHRPVAGKTGTTDYDAWLGGFTPQLAASVWVGYDDNRRIDNFADGRQAVPIWADFMEQALTGKPAAVFPVPPGVVPAYIDTASGKLAGKDSRNPELMYFIPGTEPKEYYEAPKQEKYEEPKKEKSFWDKLKFWN